MLDEEITLRKLEILQSFVFTNSLVKTAEELILSSVSIHKALRSLEIGMRCPLFIREGRQLKPLPAAFALAETASDLMADLSRTIKRIREKAGHGGSQIRLGAMYSLTANIVPRLIMGTKIRRSDLDIDLVLGSNEDLMKKLFDQSVDAIVIAIPKENIDSDIQVIPLFEDDLLLASPKGFKSKRRKKIDLKEFQMEKFVTLTDGFATSSGFQEAFLKAGFKPNIVMKVGDIFSLMNLVSGGIGHSLLPGRVMDLMGDSIRFTPLIERYQVRQRIAFMFLKNNERNPNILALTAEARMLHLVENAKASKG